MNNIINFNIGVAGEYNIVVARADGTIEETGWFPNLILNQGLDRLANPAGSNLRYCQVGSGSIAPAVTQTGLQTFVAGGGNASTPDSYVNEGSPSYNTLYTFSYVFTQGAVVGNITEVGVGWLTTGPNLFSRALILDNLGVPTSITLVSIDQLTVYYRLKLVPPLTDATGSFTISSTTYNYTARVAQVGSFAVWPYSTDYLTQPDGVYVFPAGSALGPITGIPTGSLLSGSNGVPQSYSPGSYFRDAVWTWSVSQGNAVGGIQCIVFFWVPASTMAFQYRVDTPIPKTNTRVLTITVRQSWARV